MSYLFIAIGIVAIVLIPDMKIHKEKLHLSYPQTVKECIKDKTIYYLFLIALASATYGIYMIGAFKIFGQMTIHDDQFLSLIGSVGNFVNGITRIFWSQSLDYV
jgi:hypothetical protein